MITRSYSDLEKYIRALAGVHQFTDKEKGYIGTFVQERGREAYLASNGWPRFLRVGQRQPVLRNGDQPYIQIEQGSMPLFITKTHPFTNEGTHEYGFYQERDQIRLIAVESSIQDVFVTLKEPLHQLDLPGSSHVPDEFFRFIGHGAYADFLRMDGQTDKAMAEEGVAKFILSQELQNHAVVQNNQLVSLRFRTNYSTAPSYF